MSGFSVALQKDYLQYLLVLNERAILRNENLWIAATAALPLAYLTKSLLLPLAYVLSATAFSVSQERKAFGSFFSWQLR